MHMHLGRPVVIVVGLIALLVAPLNADPVDAIDLDNLLLGAKIVGPVGPEVETTFENVNGDGVSDLVSSVSCPDGIAVCDPPTDAPGTIYTYVHSVTPGVDTHNDIPFPLPDTIFPLDDVNLFQLSFAAEGFNAAGSVAGFSFSEAASALGTPGAISIEHLNDGSLAWTISTDDWDTGEPITFFWQTTQPPIGPGGIYSISNGITSGSGNGPLPRPVPEPGSAALLSLAMLGVVWRARRR